MANSNVAACAPEVLHSQVEFASHQNQAGSPETEFKQTPNASFVRKFFNDRLRFPDGQELEIWSFEDETLGALVPRAPHPRQGGRHRPRPPQAVQAGAHDPPPRDRARPAQRRGRPQLLRGEGQLHVPVQGPAGRGRQPQQGRGRDLLLPLPRQHGPARPDGDVRPDDLRPGRAAGARRSSTTPSDTTRPPRRCW